MKGVVEIYGITPDGKEELVHTQDNLAVVGFSENVVDFLTTPSSVQYPVGANSSILDSSNYTVQAFSMSKQAEEFKRHQHTYETINLISNSTFTGVKYSQITVGGSWGNTSGAVINDLDGSCVVWGNPYEDLNNDLNLGTPTAPPTGTGYTKVSMAPWVGTAIAADGSLSSWGYNFSGHISDTPSGTGFIDVNCGPSHSIALSTDGSLVSWGDDDNGEISNTPTGTGFIGICAGTYVSHALAADGSIVSWGSDSFKQVTDTPTGKGFIKVSAAGAMSLALTKSGTLVGWGTDVAGVLDNIPTEGTFIDISMNNYFGAAITEDGSIVTWATNDYYGLLQSPLGNGFTQVDGARFAGGALHSDGSVHAWGMDQPFINDAPINVGTDGWFLSDVSMNKNAVIGPTWDYEGYILSADLSSGCIYQEIGFDGGDNEFTAPYFSATEFTFSVDLKLNKDDPCVTSSGLSFGSDYSGYSHVKLGLNTNSPRTSIRWDGSGGAHLLNNEYSKWDGGIRKLSNDWYRVFVTGYNWGASNSISAIIYPSIGDAGVDSNIPPTSGAAGSIYMSRPQLELGRVPTEPVEGVRRLGSTYDKLAYSLLNETKPYGTPPGIPDMGTDPKNFNYIVVSGSGGKSLSSVYNPAARIDKGASAYIPSSTSLNRVNYLDRELTPGARTSVEEALGIEFIKGQYPAALSLLRSTGLQLSSFRSDWSYTDDYIPYIGRHVGYLGSYVTHAEQIYPAIKFVSANSIAAFDDPLIDRGFYEGLGSSSLGGLDRYGYCTLSANGEHVTGLVDGGRSRFYKTILPDFSSTTAVTYNLQIGNIPSPPEAGAGEDVIEEPEPQKDSPLLNIFGGVDTIGLWGLDLEAIRNANIANNPPYTEVMDTSNILVEPVRRYKLFNKINLSDNIVKCEGVPTVAGIIGYYDSFKLAWRISFL